MITPQITPSEFLALRHDRTTYFSMLPRDVMQYVIYPLLAEKYFSTSDLSVRRPLLIESPPLDISSKVMYGISAACLAYSCYSLSTRSIRLLFGSFSILAGTCVRSRNIAESQVKLEICKSFRKDVKEVVSYFYKVLASREYQTLSEISMSRNRVTETEFDAFNQLIDPCANLIRLLKSKYSLSTFNNLEFPTKHIHVECDFSNKEFMKSCRHALLRNDQILRNELISPSDDTTNKTELQVRLKENKSFFSIFLIFHRAFS